MELVSARAIPADNVENHVRRATVVVDPYLPVSANLDDHQVRNCLRWHEVQVRCQRPRRVRGEDGQVTRGRRRINRRVDHNSRDAGSRHARVVRVGHVNIDGCVGSNLRGRCSGTSARVQDARGREAVEQGAAKRAAVPANNIEDNVGLAVGVVDHHVPVASNLHRHKVRDVAPRPKVDIRRERRRLA